jgi:PAS domain S-box-containing protein
MIRLPSSIRPWVLMLLVALFAGLAPAALTFVFSASVSDVLSGPAGPAAQWIVAIAVYVPTSIALIALVERLRRAGEDARQRERAAHENEMAGAAQRALLEAALVSVDAGVHSWNPMTGEAQWDSRMRSLFGLPPEHAASHAALMARVHPDDRARVEAAVARVTTADGPSRYCVEYRILRGDDELRWISSTGFAVFESDRLARVVGTARDVTERRRVEAALRDSEQRFATLAEGSPVLLWVNGSSGGELVNRAYLDFVGVNSDRDVRGYDWSRYVHPDDRDQYLRSYRRAFAAQMQFTAEFRFRRHDGEYRWMRSDATPRFGDKDEFQGYVGASVDITERRRAEDALHIADRQKDEFLAMLAHELRNPLAPIRSASEVLALRYASDAHAAAPIAILLRHSEHLARLLDGLRDFTRFAQGGLAVRKDALEIGGLVSQAVEAVGVLARAKSQALRLERDEALLYVSGDRTQLLQCVTSVLHDAVELAHVGGEIVAAVRDANNDIEITVKDNGSGTGAEPVRQAFDLCVQTGSPPESSQGGVRIGLSVVKRLIEMHRGAVYVESGGDGRGTTVTIRLPRSDPPPMPAGPLEATKSARRVLIVDESADAADSLAMLLALEGHDVCTAHSAASALETAERLQPEFAFIDIGLPQMDGYEVARRLRESNRCRAIRLVALTRYGQAADRAQAWRAGFDHQLVKPADREAVDSVLAEAAPDDQLAPRTGSGASAGSV